MTPSTPRVSVYIIAYNEADKIKAAVESVLWADEIVVADSHSSDGTAQIAESLGARVVQLEFKGFGDLRNQAVAACRHEWIFSLDADERATPAARDEILRTVAKADACDVYFVPRRNYFMGRWIRHSGWYPNYRQPQLFRKGRLSYANDPVHEAYVIAEGGTQGYLKAPIVQIPYKDLAQMLHKVNRYSTLGVSKITHKPGHMSTALGHGLWAFFKHYVLKRGFLDGWAGFVIALEYFEVTFYRYAKLHEFLQRWEIPTAPPVRRRTP